MKVYLGADHQGWHLKNKVAAYLAKRGYDVEDVGGKELDPGDDFPQFAQAAALKLIDEEDDSDKAILLCGGGQGMAMAANRFRGVRAIVAFSAEDARYGRSDNDANVLTLPARILEQEDDIVWQDIVFTFLNTEFSGAARYIRRNKELDELA
ncbi:RpiB/LacA/LacB family sugar-phosphate isomerase [Candidatus Saccharibacteria bacterium]|nr:RpiB/LacA/LacB family sugar-phosphate isomerase [Candidatus Saccharibacteria bacterium]MCL1962936.1 RpiB/LacA/LacB family sugar-phosphate isomerase [Candidatus Saccharibacteria bacterium]